MTAEERRGLKILVSQKIRETVKDDVPMVVCAAEGCLNEFEITHQRGGQSKVRKFCSTKCQYREKNRRALEKSRAAKLSITRAA